MTTSQVNVNSEGDLKPQNENEEQEEEIDQNALEDYFPHRVFLNNVDSFNAKHIASFLTDQIYGASLLNKAGGMGEGDVNEEDEPADEKLQIPIGQLYNYEIVGTLSASFEEKSEDILYTVDEYDPAIYKEELLKCKFIIYDITKNPREIQKALDCLSLIETELENLKAIGPKTYERYTHVRVFILISTVMTWALTKPLDRDDPDLPFSEVDYKKRRSHPNYKEHFACEKEVIKRGQNYKEKLKTYVIGSGVTYGDEESDLEFFFKLAWFNEVLPLFLPGNNLIPLIHVKDLSKALHGLMEIAPTKPQYILAVEQTPTSLKQIVKTLSKWMGKGKLSNVKPEDAFLYTNMSQQIFERCTVNLNMEPVFIIENLQIQWKNEASLGENMKEIVTEFRIARNLKPVKIVLHGPPGVGKTKLARRLCEYYGARYITLQTMVEDYLNELRDTIVRINEQRANKQKTEIGEEDVLEEEDDEEEEEEEEEFEDPEAILEEIREIETLMDNENKTLPDDYALTLLKKYLNNNFCQNQGYVLDGYPLTELQAKKLFGGGGGGDDAGEGGGGEEDEQGGPFPNKITPDIVISLDGPDEFLCKRIMIKPEEEIKDTPYAEENFLRRLEEFRKDNQEDITVLNYFDELEVIIKLFDITIDVDEEKIFTSIAEKLGPPSHFGLTTEEKEELYRMEEEERQLNKEKEELNRKLLAEKADQDHKDKLEMWTATLERLQYEEEKVLIAQSEPLRDYLVKFVFPTLTKGLLELVALKPDDPVDFLAEYLFKENPEGKLFDPSYCSIDQDLYDTFKLEIQNIVDTHEAFAD